MTSYQRIHEIQYVTGWSQEKIQEKTGLSLSTISRAFRILEYEGDRVTQKLIAQLHQKVVRSPFPKDIELLFEHYDFCRENLSENDFSRTQDALEDLLKNHKAFATSTLAACRLYWLLGHIHYDRAFYLKMNPIQTTVAAQTHYQQALEILKTHFDYLIVYQYKLQQCLVSTLFNSCASQKRAQNTKIRQWLLAMNYIDTVKAVIEAEPWNWIAARNGLVAASILCRQAECWLFWQAMQKVHKKFANLNFRPTSKKRFWLPIAHDPDLIWFVKLIQEQNS
ncbi:MAG: hypothetical protein SVR94_06110 [Pseudomonadota bacterium]|nr:hypothetical protein [Pseudomonadota bacterium]